MAPPVADLGDRGLDGRGVEEVGSDAEGVGGAEAGERRGGLIEIGAGAGEHRHSGAVGREAVGGGTAHPGGAAGDDDCGTG